MKNGPFLLFGGRTMLQFAYFFVNLQIDKLWLWTEKSCNLCQISK